MPSFISNFKNNKQFSFARAMLFVAILSVSLVLTSYIWVDQINIVSERISDIRNDNFLEAEAITVGNSHSVAINFEVLGITHVPLWSPGGELFEARVILEEAYNSGARPKWLFLTLNPFILLQENGLSSDVSNSRLLPNKQREYAYVILRELSAFTLIRNDITGYLRSNLVPLRVDGRQGLSLASYFRCIIAPTDICTNPKFTFSQEAKPINPDFHPYYRFPILLSLVTPSLKEGSTIAEDSLEELRKIQKLAQKHNTHFVLFESPLSQWYVEGMLDGLAKAKADPNERYSAVMNNKRAVLEEKPLLHKYLKKMSDMVGSEDYLNKLPIEPFELQKAIMQELATTNDCIILPNVLWQRSSDGIREEWFADLLHLNEKGSTLFTERLKSALNSTSCRITI